MFARLPSHRLLQTLEPQSICPRCLRWLQKQPQRFLHPSTPRKQHGVLTASIRRAVGDGQYFWANGALKELLRSSGKPSYSNTLRQQSTATLDQSEPPLPKHTTIPHLSSKLSDQTSTANSQLRSNESFSLRRRRSSKRSDDNTQLPLDASNRLTTHASALPAHSLRRLLTTYLSLSKPRLTFLIVLTTTSAYTLYPVPSLLSSAATATPSLSTLTLLFLTTGTFLTSASANALNMLFEPTHDARMSRTRNRPLVRGLISKTGALLFALATATFGTSALWWGVNPTTAVLAVGNIVLYAFVYTPLKRVSVVNTWVGAVVGAIPPLMGWTAAAGQVAVVGTEGLWGEAKELLLGEGSVGGWLLAGLLFCWQFPHFNALSWPIREEYKQAGYRMLCWVNPARNARVALRYSILLVPVCVGLSFYGITEPLFVPTSLAVNCWVIYEAARFWKYEGYKGSARGLFWASVWHLPIVLVLAMVLKKGLWERTWRSLGFVEDWDQEEEFDVGESYLDDT